MAYRIVVPLDGEELAHEVLPYLQHLVSQADTTVTLLHVLPDLTGYAQQHIDSEHERAMSHMHHFVGKLGMPADHVDCEFRMGEPSVEILKYTALNNVSLIVMPTHGRTGIDRLLSGSVTEEVMRRAHCPMLLSKVCTDAEGEHVDCDFERILVPLDGTERGFAILPVVEQFARQNDSEVILFHDNRGYSDVGEPLENDDVWQQIEEHCRRMVSSGLRAWMQSADRGRVTDDILEAVSDHRAGMIAMSTHGRCGLGRVAYGSVVENVLRKAPVPLLVMSTAEGLPTEITEKYLG